MIKPEQSMERLSLYEDSLVVAASVYHAADTYWNKEAEVHIKGMWSLCKEMSAHITMLQQEIADLGLELEEAQWKIAEQVDDDD